MAIKEYVKTARKQYMQGFDVVQLRLPKGTKERIRKSTGESLNGYITRLVLADLEKLDEISHSESADPDGQDQDAAGTAPAPEKEKKEPPPKRTQSLEELNAFLESRRLLEKQLKEKQEQEREERRKAEEEQRSQELRDYVERCRKGAEESTAESNARVYLADPRTAELLRDPEKADDLKDIVDTETYAAMVRIERENVRKESIERAKRDFG